MDEALQALLAALGSEVRAAATPDGGKHTAWWCLGQLPTLYAKFHQTSDTRHGAEIARLVQGVLKELATSKSAGPERQELTARITDRLRHLHEQFGLPRLELKSPGASLPRPRKAS
jgi:hypothetical protein